MEKYRVIIDGTVYSVPKDRVGSQADAEQAVRNHLRDTPQIQTQRATKPKTRISDVLASLAQGATLGGSDEIFGRTEAFIRNKPAKDILARRRDDLERAFNANPALYIGGEIAGSIPTAIASAKFMRGQGIANPVARGIASGVAGGATGGFLTGEGDVAQRAPGAAFGAAAGGLMGGAGEIIAPKVSAAGQRLIARGLPETPEMLGRGAKAVTGALRQAPFIGGAFRDRADETGANAAKAIAQSIVEPIGEKIDDASSGLAAFQSVQKAVSRAYDKAFDGKVVDAGDGLEDEARKMMGVRLQKDAKGKARLIADDAPALEEKDISQVLKQLRLLDSEFGTGIISASRWKNADSELRKLAESIDPNNPKVTLQEGRARQAGAKAEQYKKLRKWLESRADKDLLQETRQIDLARKSQEIIKDAAMNMARRDMGEDAVMTANDIARAVRSNASADEILKENALLQGVASDLKTVYGQLEYNSARDNAVMNAIGANAPFLSGAGGLAALAVGTGLDGYQQQDIRNAGVGAGSLAALGLLATPKAYRNISPKIRGALGNNVFGVGPNLERLSPYVGMQLGKAANQGTE